jgi:hypothetical protein
MNNLIALVGSVGSDWGFWAAYSSLKLRSDIIEIVTHHELT